MIYKTRECIAQARSIHLAMTCGAIPYNEAKRLTKPLLEEINIVARHIANKHRVKPTDITFQDLGRNL